MPDPLVIAHRGAHDAGIAENTIEAFERARQLGADMIELDVRRTRDGQLVVFHDAAVRRHRIREMTLAELAGEVGFYPAALTEVLAWARANHMPLDVELKEDGYVEQVAPLLVSHADHATLLVTSFLDRVLRKLAPLAPGLKTGLLIALRADLAVRRARGCHAGTLVIQARLARDRILQQADAAGIQTIVWDFDPAAHAPLVIDRRVAGLIVDDIPSALALRAASSPAA